MKITRPKPRSRMPGTKACVSSSADSTLTACTWRHVDSWNSSRGPKATMAAAWTRTSHRP